MNTIKKIGLVSAVAFALFTFNACGDDSGSISASGENRALSSAVEDDESSSSINDNSSSSSVILSDSEGSSSSSSVKVNGKSSSSINDVGSSSSVVNVGLCSYGTCDEEDEIVSISGYGRTYFICKNGCYEEIVREYSSSSSSKYPVMDSVFNEQVNYGKYQDPRDGQEYKTITVTLYAGTSYEETFELFAQNLNYGKWVKSTDNVADEDTVKYCYDDDEWYCENYFGGLYSWAEAMGFPEACNSAALGSEKCPYEIEETRGSYHWAIHQGICPDGWHIQNIQEFSGTGYGSLSNIYYPNTGRWSQDNPSGRSFLLAGAFYEDGYVNLGKFTYFALPDPRVSSFVEEEEKDTRVSSYVIGIDPVAYDGHIRRSYYKAGYAVEDASSKKKKVSVRCARIITRE